jgi:predicted nucleic acid-binding protein
MILADTSVWVHHLRDREPLLEQRLTAGLILIHPFVAGELACGNLKRRDTILAELNELPAAKAATDTEVRHLIEQRRLWGLGMGWIDIHLLASALLSRCELWTFDVRLARTAKKLGLGA